MINRHDSLEGLTIFVQVIESGSFSKAATELGRAVSYISKSISKLEQRLDARLINRTTRSLSLTDVGEAYYQKVSPLVYEARAAEQSIHQLQHIPSGRLKISLPNSFGQSHLQPLLLDYAQRYPQVKLQIDYSSRLVDVIGEGYDVCIRMGQPKISNLICRPLLSYDFVTVATPDYFRTHKPPQHPHDLKQHKAVRYMFNQVPLTWDYQSKQGEVLYIDIENQVECNNLPLLKQMVLAGVGVGRLPSYECDQALRNGDLVEVLADYKMPSQSAYLVYPHRRHLSAKVQAFITLTLQYVQLKT